MIVASSAGLQESVRSWMCVKHKDPVCFGVRQEIAKEFQVVTGHVSNIIVALQLHSMSLFRIQFSEFAQRVS